MKKLILITAIITFLFACEKNSDKGYNLTTIDGWTPINQAGCLRRARPYLPGLSKIAPKDDFIDNNN